MGPDIFPESAPESIPWVKKRDESIVPFDMAKLASSIFAAHEQVDPENPAFIAQELTQAVVHFLVEEVGGRLPTTAEIADTVLKVLREVGQAPTAQAFHDYHIHRQQLRDELEILPETNAATAQCDAVGWNKARLVDRLEGEADLDGPVAREIATVVERRLLATGLVRISPGLVDELVFCELFDRGMEKRWSGRRGISVSLEALQRSLLSMEEPTPLLEWAGQELLRSYALREVFSRDVAGLVDEGILKLLGRSCPVLWSARSWSFGECSERFTSVDEALTLLDNLGSRAFSTVSTTFALDAVDAWLALSATTSDDPVSAGKRLADIVRKWVDRHGKQLVCNLFGQVPQEVSSAYSRGGLFEEHPGDRPDRWARDFSDAFAAALADDVPRCRLDLHLDGLQTPDELEPLVRRALKWAGRGTTVGFAMDRPTWSTGEGLFAPPGQSAGVVEYIGIDLAKILERAGGQDDGSIFLKRLDLVCDSALRLGLQKREFLRQRIGKDAPTMSAVVVCPVGLDRLVQTIVGRQMLADEAALALAERVLRRLSHRLARESKPYRLPFRVDAVPGEQATVDIAVGTGRNKRSGTSAAVRAAGRLHSATSGGTTLLRLPEAPSKDELVPVIIQTVRESTTCRLLLAAPRPDRQPRLFD